MYTYRIEQAIRAATVLHYDQQRKGMMSYPYVTHLLSVAFILQEYTDDEDVIIAGLLHDTLEDTDYTEAGLESDFGKRVCELVKTVTEPKEIKGKKLTWMEKKLEYTKQLKNGSKEAVMIATVDKIHNLRSIVEEYYRDPRRFVDDFGKNIAERNEAYQKIANCINKRINGPLLAEFNHVYKQYQEFITEVEQSLRNN